MGGPAPRWPLAAPANAEGPGGARTRTTVVVRHLRGPGEAAGAQPADVGLGPLDASEAGRPRGAATVSDGGSRGPQASGAPRSQEPREAEGCGQGSAEARRNKTLVR